MRIVCFFFCLALGLTACATPRIIVLSDPLDAREYNDLGVAYEASGNTSLALEAYESAFTRDRSWDQPMINHGNVHATLGNWTKAEKSYRRALERNPSNPEAMNNLAHALLNQGRTRQALEWSGKALNVDPDNALYKSTRALALRDSGEMAAALELLEDVLRDLPLEDPLRDQVLGIRDELMKAPR